MRSSHASAPVIDVPLLVGFVTFLLTDSIPGGASGLEGFLIGGLATVVLLILLMLLAIFQSANIETSASQT